jgi:TP901-1 family phage major tail protein
MIDGTYNILYINAGDGFFPVGNLVSNSFNESTDTIDSTTRDNAGWKTQTLTNQSYNLEFNGLVSNAISTTKINYDTIKNIKRNKQIIDWKVSDNQLNIEGGKAQITSLSNDSSTDEFVSFSASLQGYGTFKNYKFEFKVNTSNTGTSNSNQFTLPLTSSFTNNINVNWGDGTSSNITSYNQAEVTHTYPTAGTYDIKITGAITDGWNFGYTGDCLKMGDILNWGGFSCTTGGFSGCVNMTSIGSDVDFLNQATNLSGYFDLCGLTSLPSTLTLENLQIGWQLFRNNLIPVLPAGMLLHNLTNGVNMFRGNPLTSGLPAGMVLGNVTIGLHMFNGCQLPNLPSTVTFASVTNGESMLNNNSLIDMPSGVTLPNLTNGTNLLYGSTINTTRYSQLLVDLENLNSNNNFSFHGGNSQYNTTGQTARNILTASPRNLTITDGGLA